MSIVLAPVFFSRIVTGPAVVADGMPPKSIGDWGDIQIPSVAPLSGAWMRGFAGDLDEEVGLVDALYLRLEPHLRRERRIDAQGDGGGRGGVLGRLELELATAGAVDADAYELCVAPEMLRERDRRRLAGHAQARHQEVERRGDCKSAPTGTRWRW